MPPASIKWGFRKQICCSRIQWKDKWLVEQALYGFHSGTFHRRLQVCDLGWIGFWVADCLLLWFSYQVLFNSFFCYIVVSIFSFKFQAAGFCLVYSNVLGCFEVMLSSVVASLCCFVRSGIIKSMIHSGSQWRWVLFFVVVEWATEAAYCVSLLLVFVSCCCYSLYLLIDWACWILTGCSSVVQLVCFAAIRIAW